METNASKDGIGAVLMQERHLVAYISRSLGLRWKKLSTDKKELLALVFVVQKWKRQLSRAHFMGKINQKNLQRLLK